MAVNGSTDIIVPLQINGKEEETGLTLDVVNPATGKACWKSSVASKSDAVRAVEAADAAFPSWSATKPAARRAIFLKAAEILESRADEYAEFMRIETGANMMFSKMFNLPKCVSKLRDIAGRIMTIDGSVPTCGDADRSAVVLKVPYGVVLGIAPWNAPYILGMRAIANVIGVGNTTVIKAPEQSPRCFWALGRAFTEAGLPPGVLNIICCGPRDAPDITSTIISHRAVKKVNFTGSVNVGRAISTLCGTHLKPSLMELGGKNSAIVLPDADLDLAAQECIKGSFLNNGQICMSTDRIIVHQSVESSFSKKLQQSLGKQYPANGPRPTHISSNAKSRVQSLTDEASSKGASLANATAEAQTTTNEKDQDTGYQADPTIIFNAKENMKIWQEEIFGLAVACMSVDSEENAIKLANNTECGLSASVFTNDLRTGLRVAKRLDSGAVHINGMTIHDEPSLPHGGFKSSGWGRFNATEGLLEWLQSKTVTWKD